MQFKNMVAALAVPAVASAAALPQEQVDDIVGGTAASAGDFPFIVSVQLDGRHFCGGSLLNADTVITAAHCIISGVTDGEGVTVRAGSLSRSSGGVVSEVTTGIIDPRYSDFALNWDVAVLKLATPIPESSSISYASLPAVGSDPTPGSQAEVAGWGALRESGSGSLPVQLQKVTVPIVSRADCNEAYGAGVTPQMICAGVPAGGKDSCQGDSGGPIVDAAKNLIGIVSWGQGCARPGFPGVYTRVAAVTDFINDNA